MKPLIALAFVAALQGCAEQAPDLRDELMDRIERQVHLPRGAQPLTAYARYYSVDKQGLVVGVYTSLFDDVASDLGCGELGANFELQDAPCPTPTPSIHNLGANQRRWLNKYDELPSVNDGGCGIINVVFDRRAGVLRHVDCNGPM